MTLSDKEIIETINNTESKALLALDIVANRLLAIKNDIDIPIILLSVDDSMPMLYKQAYLFKNRSKLSGKKSFIKYRDFIKNGESSALPDHVNNHPSTAVIVYTSGTTGQQKGVCLSNDNFNALATQDYNGVMDFIRQKTCLIILPPFIGFGITQIHIMAAAGIISILQIDLEPKNIIKQLFKHNPYVFLTGPALVDAFLDHKVQDLSGVKYFIGGGGAISHNQTEAINTMLSKCNSSATYSNGYGMTEASSLLCSSANEISKEGSVGIPFVDTNVKIIDVDTQEECSYGETGELWFSSPNLMAGYFKQPDQSEEIIVRDSEGVSWLRTGDLGTVDEDGFVFLKGRLKRIYVTRGKDNAAYKLFPQLIEETMREMSEVVDCGVIVREDEARMNVAIAFAKVKERPHSSEMEKTLVSRINAYLHDRLPEHMQPESIYISESLPTLPSGKIDYRALEDIVNCYS